MAQNSAILGQFLYIVSCLLTFVKLCALCDEGNFLYNDEAATASAYINLFSLYWFLQFLEQGLVLLYASAVAQDGRNL
ncbi:unnamed protein product [Blepharisma stoltei]|uniref:Uncharacterized protein n=1 Tax=Blepharisma stoltei TaxID=1481888 RepID=A0AAU9JYM4_9CILI|nr:unnamed protein product [Blepharisma stoltei]